MANDFSFLYPNGTFLTDEGSFLVTAPASTPNAVVSAHIRGAFTMMPKDPAISDAATAEPPKDRRSKKD